MTHAARCGDVTHFVNFYLKTKHCLHVFIITSLVCQFLSFELAVFVNWEIFSRVKHKLSSFCALVRKAVAQPE